MKNFDKAVFNQDILCIADLDNRILGINVQVFSTQSKPSIAVVVQNKSMPSLINEGHSVSQAVGKLFYGLGKNFKTDYEIYLYMGEKFPVRTLRHNKDCTYEFIEVESSNEIYFIK